jgi:hypothetical protein
MNTTARILIGRTMISRIHTLESRADLLTRSDAAKIVNVFVSRNEKKAYEMKTSVFIRVGLDRLIATANEGAMFVGHTRVGVVGSGTDYVLSVDRVLANVIRVQMSDDMAKDLEATGCVIKYNFRTDALLVPFEGPQGKGWVNTRTNKFTSTPSKAFETFHFLCTSTSEEKNAITTWVKTEDESKPFAIINTVIPGFIDNLPSTMSKAKSNTTAARVGLAKLAGKEYLLDSVGYFDGEFDKTGNNGHDGLAYMPYSVASKVFGVTGKALRNLTIQPRIYGVYKMQVKVIPDVAYIAMYKELTTNRVEAFTTTTIGAKSKYPSIIVDANVKKAEIDLSQGIVLTVKALGDAKKGAYVNKQILQKVIYEAARMGDVAFEQVMTYLKTKGLETIREALDSCLDAPYAPVLTDSDYNVINSLVRDPRVIDRALRNAHVGMARMIHKLHIKEDNIFNGVVSCDFAGIFGLQILDKNEVLYGRVSKEMKELRDKKDNSAEDMEKYLAYFNEYRIGLIFKYPSMGLREFLTATILGTDEVCIKVDHSGASDEIKRALKAYYSEMAESSIEFACFKETYKMLAGMDNDFDHAQIVFNQLFTSILGGKEELVNISPKRVTEAAPVKPLNIREAKDDVAELAKAYGLTPEEYLIYKGSRHTTSDEVTLRYSNGSYNYGFFFHSYVVYREMSGSVGLISQANDKICAMLTMALRGDFSAVDQLLAELFGGVTTEMEDNFDVDCSIVDPNCADRIVYAMSRCKWTEANKIKFLVVCNKLFRLYQECCIDATKTGVFIAACVTTDTIKVTSLSKVGYNYETQSVVMAGFTSRKVNVTHISGAREQMDSCLFVDPMGELASYLVEKANALVALFRIDHADELVHSAEMQTVFSNTIGLAASKVTSNTTLESLRTLKDVHASIKRAYRDRIKTLAEKKMEDEEREALMEAYKNQMVVALNDLSSVVKQVCSKTLVRNDARANTVMIGRLLDAVTNTNRYNKYQGYAGSFAADCNKEALIAAYVGDSYKTYGTILEGRNKLDEVLYSIGVQTISVSFDNGVNNSFGKTIILKERFTGEAIYDGKDLFVVNDVVAVQDELNVKCLVVDAAKVNAVFNAIKEKTNINNYVTKNSVIQVEKDGVYFWVDAKNKPNARVKLPVKSEFDNIAMGVPYYVNSVTAITTQANKNDESKKAYFEDKDSLYMVVERA